MHSPSLSTAAAVLLAAMPAAQASIYTKNSPVLQVDSKSYDRLIAKSNYTSIVEFYAPWCGHCKNLKPAYEKAAKNLDGLAKVAAVNCDEESNKSFCGSMGVSGFPTLKIVRPGSKKGKPVVEDYQGARSAQGIVEAVVDKINNHVKRVSDKEVDKFLSTNNETAKAILFTEKGTTSALLRSVAIEFLGVIEVAQIRNSQKAAVQTFGVSKFPSMVLLPGGAADGIVYEGEMKKDELVKFLSQAGSPNPDPPAAAAKSKKEKTKSTPKKAKTESSSTATASKAATESASKEAVPEPTVEQPVIVETALPIPTILRAEALVKQCLSATSKTCILAFVPSKHGDVAEKALSALAELDHKNIQGKRNLFPFFEVHKEDAHSKDLLKALGSTGEVQILAVNARRGWWRQYGGSEYTQESIEQWIDQIRMSEGEKKKLPAGIATLLVAESEQDSEAAAEKPAAASPEAEAEPTPAATPSDQPTAAIPAETITPDAESISTTATVETPTAFSGADPTVEVDTAKETPTAEAVHDEL